LSSFVETHGEKQKDYCYWKFDKLKPFAVGFSEISTFKRVRKNGKIITDYRSPSTAYVVRTMTHLLFSEMEKVWYVRNPDGAYKLDANNRRIKCLPETLILDELSLSVWWFDDGSHNLADSRGAVFNTQGFSKEECERLRHILDKGYNIQTALGTNRGKSIIHVVHKSYGDLMNIIMKYLPCDSMCRKITKVNDEN
jgi:hypothetical protein